ncbi:MAG: MCE family protein [Acidaminococcaceae bacterium]|nr:MCE family protein [Acidaminococcaceae bacterium]
MNASETKVGALTLGGAVILAGMISFLGAFKLFDGGYDLHVAYPSVNGLQEGSSVRYAGVPVGTVKKARVEPDQVVVTMHVNKGIQIPQEAEFSIGSDGVMGEKFVDIRAPQKYSGVYLKPDSTLTGNSSGDLNEFLAQSGKVLEKVEGIADALNNVFGDKEVQKSMRDGFINARDISNNLNKFTKVMADSAKENQAELKNMVSQFNQMSVRMNKAMGHLESLMEGVDANGKTGKNVAVMARNLAVTSKNLEVITNTLADVAKDPQTKEDLKATIHNARGVTERANKILGLGDGMKVKPHADVFHSAKGGQWRSNFGLQFEKEKKGTFGYLGASSIGDDTKLDLYFGKRFKRLNVSAGAMQGKAGIGLGYDISDRFRIYSQLYDFSDAKLRLGGEYMIRKDIFVVGESLDVLHGSRRDLYLGARIYF